MRLDVGRSVLLQQGQLIPKVKHTVQDGLFLRVEWGPHSWRVAHVRFLALQSMQYSIALLSRVR